MDEVDIDEICVGVGSRFDVTPKKIVPSECNHNQQVMMAVFKELEDEETNSTIQVLEEDGIWRKVQIKVNEVIVATGWIKEGMLRFSLERMGYETKTKDEKASPRV